ncbi:MAG: hypothetical protein ABI972_14850 [Acidobacteriota bacterium]
MSRWVERWREWNERTHGPGFELRRHFFQRFFDSELVSTPGQWRVVAGGAIGLVASLVLVFTQSYYSKYLALLQMDTGEAYRKAVIADHLFFITLSMLLTGLFTALQWQSLFPSRRDYLALAGLPVTARQIFGAKAAALLMLAIAYIVCVNLLPSGILSAVAFGRYQRNAFLSVVTLFTSASMAGLFVFFVLIAAQGVLLSATPARWLAPVTLFSQGALVVVILCALPLAVPIPGLYWAMDQRPDFARWLPPVWFLAADQQVLGNREEYVRALAALAWRVLPASGLAAGAAHLWSYYVHRVSVLESSGDPGNASRSGLRMRGYLAGVLFPRSQELAVFSFMAKTLGRSGPHRLALTGYAGMGIAIVVATFAAVGLSPSFRGFAVRTAAVQQTAISAPLALSLFLLTGFRYLFRLPVELRANWVFQVNEGGNRRLFLDAAERFLLWFGVAPVALAAVPTEMALLGWMDGAVALTCVTMTMLILVELLLLTFQKVPFTCSYLPGKRSLAETALFFGVGAGVYIYFLSLIFTRCLGEPPLALSLFGLQLAAWAYLRRARKESAVLGKLEFEEELEPEVTQLGIGRD